MKNEKMKSAGMGVLRHKAEVQLKKKHLVKVVPLTEADTMKLIHELEIHQIELGLQNEELQLERDKAKIAAEKFNLLYEDAYTGYFTLIPDGRIFWLNLSGARMLGKERSKLVNKFFKKYVTLDTLAEFNDFFLNVFETNSNVSCEVRMIITGSPSIYVHIEGILSRDEHKCLLTLVDITKRKRAEEALQLKAMDLDKFNDLMEVSELRMYELKSKINMLLKKLGEKERFKISN